jgi:hypothetical protein
VSDRQISTTQAALDESEAIGKSLANAAALPDPIVSKLRLFDGTINVTVNTTQDELIAAEAVFTGYTSGGYDLTTFSGPLFVPGGGAVILFNQINVAYVSGAAATIGGWWLEDPASKVRTVFIYDPPRQLGQVGDGWPLAAQLGYGRN